MKNVILQSTIILTSMSIMVACNPTNRFTTQNQKKMFTIEQITAILSTVRTGADFPEVAYRLKDLGITCYETRMEDGSSVFQGKDNYKVQAGPNYKAIKVAGNVNAVQLKTDISHHQQGKSGYHEISLQCAEAGIEKWAVNLIDMTCTYIDKAGNEVWVEHIPQPSPQDKVFTIEQIKAAHSKVKSGADFPKYIREIKALGVRTYETWVKDSHTDYWGANNYHTASKPLYDALDIAAISNKVTFEQCLKAHQQGTSDYLTFCKQCAANGIEKWFVRLDQMTCTYYDKAGNTILTEPIPQ